MVAAKKPEEKYDDAARLVVLAPLITAMFTDGQIRYFRKGDVLPDGITGTSLAHLLDTALIAADK